MRCLLMGMTFKGVLIFLLEQAAEAQRKYYLFMSYAITHLLRSLYVGSLHFNLSESDIKQVFEPFGELDFVDLHKDPTTGRSKGYAFIQYVGRIRSQRVVVTLAALAINVRRMQRWLSRIWKDSNWLVVR